LWHWQVNGRRDASGRVKAMKLRGLCSAHALADPLTPEPEYVPGPRRRLKTATPRKFIPTDEDTGL
jgi:hypothetical protein